VTTTLDPQNAGTAGNSTETDGVASLEKVRDLLSRQIDETARAFEKKTGQIDDQLARGMRELRQQIHGQHQQLSDDLKRQADEILERLARESQELRTDKTDRASLAALLTEMAMRLTDDFRLPPATGEPRE
jgi:hypothetical protein